MNFSFIDIDSRNRTFKIRISDITPEFYGAEVRCSVDDQYSVGGRGSIGVAGRTGKIGTGVTEWISDTISEYYREDPYTGNISTEKFNVGELYTIHCNLVLADNSDYLLAGDAELVFTQEGLIPVVTNFSVRPDAAGTKRAFYTIYVENIYINKNDATSYFEIYVNDEMVKKEEIGSTPIRSSVTFDDFGIYTVSVRIENIFSPNDGVPVYIYSDVVSVTVRAPDEVDAADCKILYDYADEEERVYDDGRTTVIIKGFVDISKHNWLKFCDAINYLRDYCGLTQYEFTYDDVLTASMWNQAIVAFDAVAGAYGDYFDAEKFLVTRGMVVSKELIDNVNNEIALVLGIDEN